MKWNLGNKILAAQLVVVLIIVAMVTCGAAVLPEAPEPNVPVEYDPNLLISKVMDYKETEVGVSFIYEFKAISLRGRPIPAENVTLSEMNAPVTDYEVLVDEPNEGTLTLQVDGNDVTLPVFVHPIRFIWTPMESRLVYLNITVTNVDGVTNSRTLLLNVVPNDELQLYPADEIVLTTYRKAQELWMRAHVSAVKRGQWVEEIVYDDGNIQVGTLWLKGNPTSPTHRLHGRSLLL